MTPAHKQKINVLIAEDSPTQAKHLKFILEGAGYEVSVAANGKEALLLLETTRPGLVISDIVMPEMDGYELCRRIKGDERFKQIAVILVTVLYDPADVIRGLESGADNFISKPYDEKYLLSRIEIVLAGSYTNEIENVQIGLDISFSGKKHHITASRLQILTMLLSTYETAVQKNHELTKAQDELRELNEHLEDLVAERTLELKKTNRELLKEVEVRKKAEKDLQRSNRAYRVISECNQLLVRAEDVQELLDNICTILVASGGYRSAWVGYARNDKDKTVEPVAWSGFEENYFKGLRISWKKGRYGNGPTGTAIRTGNLNVISDIPHNPKCGSWVPDAIRGEYSAVAAIPLKIKEKVIGALTIFSGDAGAFDSDEMQVLSEMADDLAFGLETLRVRSAHEKSEQELKASEIRYRRLFEAAKDGILILNAESGKIIDANPFILNLIGHTHESLTGKYLWEIGLLKDKSQAEQAFTDLKRDGYVRYEDLPLVTKDGQKRDVEFISNIYEVGPGKVIQCNIRDITERKRAEEALRESRDRFETTIASLDDAILLVDPPTRLISDCNDATTRIFGYSREELVGRETNFLHVDQAHLEQFGREARATYEDPGYYSREFEMRRKDGGIFPTEHFVRPIHNPDGRIRYVVSVVRDITKRKQAEKAVQDSEVRFRELADSITDVFFAMDKDLRYTYWNKASEELTGVPAQDAIGKSIHEIFPDSPETRRALEVYKDVIKTKRPRSFENEYHEGSKRFYFDISVYPTADGIAVISTDITERKRAEEALRESEERFRTILLLMQFGTVIIDAQTHTILDANKKALEMIGGGTDCIVGSVCHRFICPAESGRCPVTDLKQTIDFSERVLLTLKGDKMPILKSVIPTTLGGKKVLIESFIDITDRKQAEEALYKSEQNLVRAQAVGRIGNWEWDIAGNSLLWSDEVYRIFGVPDDFILSYGTIASLIHPDDREQNDRIVQDSLKTGAGAESEFRIIRPDGEVRWVYQKMEVTRDGAGTPITAFGVTQDITERKQMEKEIRALNRDLEKRVEERTGELKEKYHELETFNKAMVDREMRIIEMKEEVNRLCQELGRGPKYQVLINDDTKG